MKRFVLVHLMVVAVATPLASTARALEGDADAAASSRSRATQAKEAFERARQSFERREYRAAAEAFEQSADYVLHPAPLANAADAWARAGDNVRAARACDRALAISDIDRRTRAVTEETLGNVLRRVATLEIEGKPGISLRVDGESAGVVPLRMRLHPGTHVIEATDPSRGTTRRMTLVLDPGMTTTRAVHATGEPAKLEEAPGRPSEKATSGPPLLTYAAYAVAAAGVGTGIYFGVSTLDARERWANDGSTDARSDFYRDRALTNVAFGVGMVAAVVGTVLWLTASPGPKASGLASGTIGTFGPWRPTRR